MYPKTSATKPHRFLEQYWVTPLNQPKLTQEYERARC
ncbi:hypothetical protein T01_1549 [Trichinella spiralis]|uniref:Uncharacterized protein n=1 Tax=Trichinella spiralis TaxID=6334 RepID=A0A0V0ZPC9_TRISP|nr:hypothetical protein T01_1549 [Trichinella spiralis]